MQFLLRLIVIEGVDIMKHLSNLRPIPFLLVTLFWSLSAFPSSGTSIERLQNRFLTMHSFRNEAAKALVDLLNRPESQDCVIALPPSGLMGGYLRAIKKANGTTVVVTDKPENILQRSGSTI